MRTTLTLDTDVAALIERLRKTKGMPLKDIVNQALREGLKRMMSPPPDKRTTFQTRSVDLGRCHLPNVDNVAEAIAMAEGESYR